MKNVLAVGVLMTLALSACGYPQMYKIYNYPETDAEETYTPIKRQYYMPRIADGIFDEHTNVDSSSHEEPTDVGTQDYNIETNPYIHSYFYEMMRKLQEALNRIHQKTLESGPDVDNDEFGFGHVNSEYPSFDLSNAKNTTTSETKVIDGQIVTVNETLINNADDENGGTVIRIKTIQVKPSEKSPTEEDETTTPVEDIENHTVETDSPEINEPVAKRNDESNDIPNGGIDDQVGFEVDDLNRA